MRLPALLSHREARAQGLNHAWGHRFTTREPIGEQNAEYNMRICPAASS